jgi:hypothetical protein
MPRLVDSTTLQRGRASSGRLHLVPAQKAAHAQPPRLHVAQMMHQRLSKAKCVSLSAGLDLTGETRSGTNRLPHYFHSRIFFRCPSFFDDRQRSGASVRREPKKAASISNSWRSTISHRGCSSRQFEQLFSAASELVCRCAKIVAKLRRGGQVLAPQRGADVWAV